MLVDAQGYNPGWMSADRRTIYGDRTTTLWRTRDWGDSWQAIKTFARGCPGVRELDNGELLVSMSGDGVSQNGELA